MGLQGNRTKDGGVYVLNMLEKPFISNNICIYKLPVKFSTCVGTGKGTPGLECSDPVAL